MMEYFLFNLLIASLIMKKICTQRGTKGHRAPTTLRNSQIFNGNKGMN